MTAFNYWMLPIAQAQPAGTRELVDGLARTPLSHVVLFVAVLTILRLAVVPYLRNTRIHLRSTPYAAAKFFNEMLDAFIYAGVFVFMVIRPFGVQAFLVPSGSMWPTLEVNDFIVANKAVYRYSEPSAGDIIVFHPPAVAAIRHSDLDADGELKMDYVKRCIGAPGDLVEIKKGVVYRNGIAVPEPYKTYSDCIDQEEPCQSFRVVSDDAKKDLTLANFKLVNYKGEVIPLNYTELDANAADPRTDGLPGDKIPYHVARKFQLSNSSEQKAALSLPAQKVPPGHFLMMGDNRNNSHDGRVWGLITRDEVIGKAEMVWWPFTHIHRLK